MASTNRAWFRAQLIPCLLIGVSFPIVGYFIGWFVGASRVPVIATFIPLVIGLLGAVPVALLERRLAANKFMEAVKTLQEKRELDVGVAGKISSKLGDAAETSLWLPAFWSVGVILFCVASYFGTENGIRQRIGVEIPAIADLLKKTNDPQEKPTPEELSYLYRLRWTLISKNYSAAEARSLFSDVVNPIFDKANAANVMIEVTSPPAPGSATPPPPPTISGSAPQPPTPSTSGSTAPPPPPATNSGSMSDEQIKRWRSSRPTSLREATYWIVDIKELPFGQNGGAGAAPAQSGPP
jgi:hypothetical protein